MKLLDLKSVVGEEARVLIGHERGVAVRKAFNLDQLDNDAEPVRIIVPGTLRTLTPSFVQGLFAGSVQRLGENQFYSHYTFETDPSVLGDIHAGVDRVLTSRHLAGVA
jgi:hypothetical protein